MIERVEARLRRGRARPLRDLQLRAARAPRRSTTGATGSGARCWGWAWGPSRPIRPAPEPPHGARRANPRRLAAPTWRRCAAAWRRWRSRGARAGRSRGARRCSWRCARSRGWTRRRFAAEFGAPPRHFYRRADPRAVRRRAARGGRRRRSAADAPGAGCSRTASSGNSCKFSQRVSASIAREDESAPTLTARQEEVLRAVVTAYVGEAAPVGSKMLSHVLPTRLSSASIRNTLAELDALGLVEQPHTSAGRVPSEAGLRLFIDQLLGRPPLSDYDRRTIDFGVEGADPHTVGRVVVPDAVGAHAPARLRAHPAHGPRGAPAHEPGAAVQRARAGGAGRRPPARPTSAWCEDGAGLDDRTLERISAILRERVRGRTLPEVRDLLRREAHSLRLRADAAALPRS